MNDNPTDQDWSELKNDMKQLLTEAEKREAVDRAIEVDRIALHAADTGYLMDDPHPKGYFLTTAGRMRRALYAYEWAKVHKPEWEVAEMPGYYTLPNASVVRTAVLENEGRPDE